MARYTSSSAISFFDSSFRVCPRTRILSVSANLAFYERNTSLAKRENALALIVLLVMQFAHVLLLTLYADVELSWSTSR